jgi:hypothetical protein
VRLARIYKPRGKSPPKNFNADGRETSINGKPISRGKGIDPDNPIPLQSIRSRQPIPLENGFVSGRGFSRAAHFERKMPL